MLRVFQGAIDLTFAPLSPRASQGRRLFARQTHQLPPGFIRRSCTISQLPHVDFLRFSCSANPPTYQSHSQAQMHPQSFLLPLLLILPTSLAKKSYTKSKDAVLLSQIRSLTLQSAKQTTGRRSSPIPQLTCIGGNARGKYEVDVMQCKNSGSEYDAEDIQWTCQASLPPEFKLGSTDVVCEGYDSPEDVFVLKGSCGVEYRLVLTELGEEKYGSGGFWGGGGQGRMTGDGQSTSEKWINRFFSVLFWVVFIGELVSLSLFPILPS